MKSLQEKIRQFNKVFPNGSITTQRIIVDFAEGCKSEPCLYKTTIIPDCNVSSRIFTGYGTADNDMDAETISIERVLDRICLYDNLEE